MKPWTRLPPVVGPNGPIPVLRGDADWNSHESASAPGANGIRSSARALPPHSKTIVGSGDANQNCIGAWIMQFWMETSMPGTRPFHSIGDTIR
jgi:hypothetical protein